MRVSLIHHFPKRMVMRKAASGRAGISQMSSFMSTYPFMESKRSTISVSRFR